MLKGEQQQKNMPKNYAIARIKKYSHVSQVTYLVNHHLRLVPVPNADPKRAHKNEVLVQKDVVDFLEDVPKGSKKNAVRFVDCVFAGSRFDTPQQEKEWQEATFDFIKKEFGEDNLALVVVHNDETTKHIQVIFKPVNPKTKKLGAGHWFDGRVKMKSYQDRYFNAVKHLGFERGDPSKKAEHTTLKEHYAQVNKSADAAEQEVQDLKKSLGRLKKEVQDFSVMDIFKPAKFMDRVKPHLYRVLKKGKEVLQYQAYNQVEQKEQKSKRLAEENEALRHKLEAITGVENPNWVEVKKYADVVSADAEKGTEVLKKKGVGVEESLAKKPTMPETKSTKKLKV